MMKETLPSSKKRMLFFSVDGTGVNLIATWKTMNFIPCLIPYVNKKKKKQTNSIWIVDFKIKGKTIKDKRQNTITLFMTLE